MNRNIWGGILMTILRALGLTLATLLTIITWPQIASRGPITYSPINFISVFGTTAFLIGLSIWAIYRGIRHFQGKYIYPVVK